MPKAPLRLEFPTKSKRRGNDDSRLDNSRCSDWCFYLGDFGQDKRMKTQIKALPLLAFIGKKVQKWRSLKKSVLLPGTAVQSRLD